MSSITERGVLRWKEWVPLVTQQQRLRNLIQIIAYNVTIQVEKIKKNKKYYYTLHLTAMSSPFYTSEHLESENPKWVEIELKDTYGSANGVVVRLWVHVPDGSDKVITVWGVYFSGLVYIGPSLSCTDSSSLHPNSIVFHMHGGYFTAHHCFLNPHPVTPRTLTIQLSAVNVKSSYSVDLLLRLQSLQHAIKKESLATSHLQQQIAEGMFASSYENSSNTRGSVTLRKLLSKKTVPKTDPSQILNVKKEIEVVKFNLKLLTEQRDMIYSDVQKKLSERNSMLEKNQDKESELMENLCCLRRENEKKKELKFELSDSKSQLEQTASLLDLRRREIISELSYIYPIVQLPDGKYTIRDVHLPNSEDFEGKDELMISVALGFVAHLVQMISYFLNVPTRYPICHFGSRSKIIDHITDSIPDTEREFPLYSRGKEKHTFNYGVYLLNKNIAQLRWYFGLTTSDLRHTLPNLLALMTLNKRSGISRNVPFISGKERKTALSCSLDQGLDDIPARLVNSDPQQYGSDKKIHYHQTSPIHDLASLMSLDIPSRTNGNFKKELSVSPPFSVKLKMDTSEKNVSDLSPDKSQNSDKEKVQEKLYQSRSHDDVTNLQEDPDLSYINYST